MATSTPILVPRRADNGHRDRLWQFVKAQWEKNGYGPIVEGHHNEGLFSRSAAINLAAREAGDWEVAIVADADVVFESWEQPRHAAELADGGCLAYAHRRHHMLPWAATEKVLAGEQPQAEWAEQAVDNTMSSCWAISRKSWETLGGFDERFEGWGAEDWAWFAASETLLGIRRVEAFSFHLWHSRDPAWEEGNAHYEENIALGNRYMALRGNQDGMRAILSERVAA